MAQELSVRLNPEDKRPLYRQIYEYIRENGFITTKQVLANTRISTHQGSSVALNRLIDRGLIVKQGIGHKTYYVLASDK